MNIKSRLIMGVLGLILAAAGVFLLGVFWELFNVSGTGLEGLAGVRDTAIAGIIVFLLGIVLLLLSFSGAGKQAQEKSKARSIVQYSETGEIRISLVAIENMVLRVSRQVKGIRETVTRVDYNDQGLLLYVKVKVIPDMQIPQLVSELQKNIKDYIEDMTGTSVAEVKVMVEDIASEQIAPRKK